MLARHAFPRHRWLIVLWAVIAASVLLLAVPAVRDWGGHRNAATPAEIGQWSAPLDVKVIAIHAALLTTGKVLLYYYPVAPEDQSPAALYDPVTNTFKDVTPPFGRDIYCTGVSNLPDGRFIATGGQATSKPGPGAGTKFVTLFDPATETWLDGPEMSFARWYASNVQLPDGKTLVVAGIGEDAVTLQTKMETFDPVAETWTTLPPSAEIPTNTDLYPRLTVLNDGTVFMAGTSRATRRFDPATNQWARVGMMNFGVRLRGAVVLLPGLEKVLTSGGSTTARGDATATAEVIDFSLANGAWNYITPMNTRRKNHNLVLLADGTVLAVGGGKTGKYESPVREAELFDPATNTWTTMAAQVVQRTYHSTALLLPDGRVLSAGSDLGPMATTIEIYSPPYLFRGTRPVISSNPSTVNYAQAFVVSTPDAARISRVALIKLGATTHGNNTEQRHVDLTFSRGASELRVTGPATTAAAPPGFYMLSVVADTGVPAVMPIVKVE